MFICFSRVQHILPPWRAASLTFAAPAPGAAKEPEIPRKKSGVIRYKRVSLSDMNGEIYSNNVSAAVMAIYQL